MNLYGFAAGDPVNFGDPLGLCPTGLSLMQGYVCNAIEATTTLLGGAAGFWLGGGTGAAAALPTGELVAPATVTAGAIAGTLAGTALGKAAGENITSRLFNQDSRATSSSQGETEPTAGEIISKSKKGSINRVFPEQFRGKTMSEIEKAAGEGDKAAKTARKLLTDRRFNKD